MDDLRGRDASLASLIAKANGERSGQIAYRIAPIGLPGSADEVAGRIVHAGGDLALPTCALHIDIQGEVTDAITQMGCPAETSGEFAAM